MHVTVDNVDIEHSPFMALIVPDGEDSHPEKVSVALSVRRDPLVG